MAATYQSLLPRRCKDTPCGGSTRDIAIIRSLPCYLDIQFDHPQRGFPRWNMNLEFSSMFRAETQHFPYPISLLPASMSIYTHAPEFECCWGRLHCGILLDDTTPSGIARHLKEHHFGTGQWHARHRGECEWEKHEGMCSREMYHASFGKHVATVHLRRMKKQCRYCHQVFSRNDALLRHLAAYCTQN